MHDNHTRVTELGLIEDGWYDGDGLGVSDLAVIAAHRWLDDPASVIDRIYGIFPTLRGGILIEINSSNDEIDEDVEFDNEGKILD